ncbi:tandem-95 repeat protein [Vibrio lentus]|uniref:VCBS domain-containing protein n=1 Tax=Vibrio lentus TaxID=136468 RepID=UPI0010BD82CD|nr:VCBS domain-containing protein [Vibrio lentus]TKF95677.1 tandem-95 repeat protein [Vibrio lentus]
MANKKNVETNKKNTEIKNKKSNEIEQKKPTQKKKRRLHSHLKVNIPLFQSLMMILPSLAKHAAAESIDNSSDAADQVTANNVTEKDVTDDHSKADSSAVALQEAQTSDSDVNSTLSASHAAHGSSSHLVPSHHLSTLSHPQVHYIPSVSMPTISSGSNGQPTHSNAPTTPALPVTFMPEVIKGTYGELHVDANGQYTFVLNPNSPQYILLNQHQPGTDHFALHLSNGSSIIVQIPVTGKQDTPSISGDLTGVVTEDHNIDSQGLLHANGKIDVIDPDQNESSVTPEVISGKYGSLTIDADGHWQYQVDNSLSNVQALTAATSLHESFTIHTKDGTPQTIDMTIGGNDDNAVITGVDAGTLTEDLTTQVQGQLSVTDSDLGEDHFQASQVTSNFGTLSITKDGAWTYNLDNNNPVVQRLGQGSTATDIVTVHSADGTAHQVTVTINGTNDHAVITSSTANSPSSFFAIGTSNGSSQVTEDKDLTVSGQLNITDIDSKEAHFSNSDLKGTLGTLHLKDNGDWTYDLDNKNPQVQALGQGSATTDIITIHSADGTPHQIAITVNGTNDKAVISGTSAGVVTEESQLQTSGTLAVTDVDTGEAHFATSSTGSTDIAGSFGMLHLTDSGAWTYVLDNKNPNVQALGKGATATDTITVHSADGTPHQVTITVNGTNDTATVSSATVAIDETDKAVTTSGTLTSTDVDNPDNTFTPDSISGTNGDLTIDTTGHWVFTANSAFNQLNVGDKVEETFTVSSVDGTPSTIKVTINGTNDTATVSSATVAIDETDKAVTTSGTLTSIDVDNPDNAFTPDSIVGSNGDLTIDANGHWVFTANSAFNQLNVGDKVEETFTVSSIDGTPSTIKITINGTNDKAVISGTSAGAVTEESQLQTSGSLTVTDVDAGQAHFSNTDIAGTLGTLHLTNSGTWTYDLDNTNPTVQALGKGTTATDTITVHSADGTPHQITITVNGTNDKAIIGGTNSGAVTEESQLQTSGTLTVTDVDTGEAHFSNTDIAGTLGTLHLTDNGTWTYDLDNTNPQVQALGKGATATDTITVHSADGTPHQVTITVNGTNDTAVIGGTSAGAVTEETQLQTSGTLTVTDTDTGEAHFANTDIQGTLGTLHLTDNGAWTYDLDNTNPAVQALGNGATATDTITVHSADGTPHQVTITVNGTNDNAVVGGVDTASVTEKAAGDNMSPDHAQSGMATLRVSTLNANGHLSVIDPDSGQSGFADNNVGYNYHGTYGDLILNPNGDWDYYADAGSLSHIGGRPTTRGSAIDKLGEGETLTDTITVHTKDGTPHNIVITINGSNDRPYCSSEVQLNAGTEDTRQTITAAQLLQNSIDVDKNDSGLLTVANLHPDHGSILDNQNGTYTFTPEKDYNGKVHFTYDVKDAHGGVTHTGATSSLSAVADKAVISGSDTGTIIEDHNVGHSSLQPVVASGLLSVTDPDAGQDHFQVNLLLGEQAIHDPFGGFLRITPSGAWGYEVANSRLQSLAEGEVEKVVYRVYSADHTAHDITITVTGTNDQPTITATTLAHGTEDTHYQIQASQFGFSDIDTGDTLHSIAITDLPSATQGKFVLDGHDVTTGQHIPTADISKLQFVPAQDFNGDVQFKYTVNDGHTDSAEATNTLHIDAVGDKAVISGVDTGDVDENRNPDMSPDFAQSGMAHLTNSMIHVEGQLTIIDPDTGENSFDSKGIGYTYHGKYGHLILNTDGKWFYGVATGTADVNGGLTTNVGSTIDQLGANETLTDTITIQSKDGTTHDIVITIHGDNDRPYCSSEVQLNSGKEDLAQTITATELLANTIDVDSNDLGKLTVANLHADHGSILDNQDGTYTFTPTKDYNGPIHFSYDVTDAHGGTTHTGASTTLTATPDGAIISEVTTDHVTEDGSHSSHNAGVTTELANGRLQVVDPDSGENKFQYSQFGESAVHDPFGGMLRIDSMGNWGYSVNNAKLQHLAQGQTETVIYRVHSYDGTAYELHIDVVGTNDAPTVTQVALSNGTEDTHYQMQASQFGFTDVDSGDTLHSVAITDLPTATQGKFVLDGHDVTAGQHIPTADISKLQFVPAQDFNGDVQFKYTVNDGHDDSQEATNTLHIDAVGDTAVITGTTTGDVDEGHGTYHDRSPNYAQLGMAKLTNDPLYTDGKLEIIDPDTGEAQFDTKGIGYSYHGTYGQLILNADGNWHYKVTVGSNQQNVATKIDQLGDGQELTDTITIYSKDGTAQDIVITIHGDNDRPYISSEVTLSTGTEDTALTFTKADLLANTVDVDANDAGKLSIENLLVDHGSVVDNKDGTYTFTPTKDYNGQVHFSYDVTDAHGGTTHTGANTSLAAVNDAATFAGDSSSIKEDTNIHHNAHITGSATIPDALSCHGHLIVSDADGHGEAALDLKGQPKISLDGTYGHFDITSTGTWVYKADNKSTPIQDLDNGQTLTDSIEVTSKDGTKHSITVTINGTTDVPTLHSLSDSGVQHSGPVEGNLLTGSGTDQGLSGAATDTDSNAHLVLQDIQIKDPVSGYVAVRPGQPHTMAGIGTLAIEANGHYTFTPEAGFTGKVPSMVYRVGDDGGNPIGDSSQNSLSIEVTPPLQHAPTVTGQTVSTNEDITRTFTTSEFGYSDQDGDALQFVTISSLPSHGLLLLNGNAVTANQQISKADLDAGHLTFTPSNNENGANYAQFTFTANDGHKNSASATMVVDVNAVNDAPIVGSSFISSLEDKPHAFTTADFKYSDIDGDALNHITITNVAHGVLSLNGTTVNVGDNVSASDVSSLIFTPTHNYFSSGVSGLGAVQFTANDGHLDSKEGSILINIASVADPATFSGDSTGVAKEDITLQASGTLTASDPDGTAGFTAVQGGAGIAGSKGYGHAHIDVNGHWTYDLDNNHPIVQQLGEGQTDTETITVQSADGTHHDIVVTITGTNDAPILGVNQTSSTTGTLTETDVDVTDSHTFSVVSSAGQFGSLSVDPNTGDYVYTPNTSITGMSYSSATNSYHGVDVFEVKVSDGHTEDSKFITFDASGHVTMSPTGGLVISTTVPQQPTVTTTLPTMQMVTNVAPANSVTLDLASTSDSGSSNTDNLTNDTTPTITGHTDIPFSKVTIYDGSTPVGHAVSDASGQYNVVVSCLPNGDHNLSAKALAPSSTLPATSPALSVHVDTDIAPLQVSLTHDTGRSTSDLITSDGALTISGQETGATIEYSVDGGHTWSNTFTPQTGSNTVEVRQTDTAGNISTSSSLTFTLDNTATAPSVSLTSDSGGSSSDKLTNVGDLNIGGIEQGATVEYSIDNGVHWSTQFTPAEGQNNVQVRQTDVAGNVSPSTSLSYTLDTQIDIRVNSAHADQHGQGMMVQVYLPKDSEVTLLEITSDGGGAPLLVDLKTVQRQGTGTSVSHPDHQYQEFVGIDLSSLPDGNLSIRVAGTDTAGNTVTAQSSASSNYVLDTTASASDDSNTAIEDSTIPVSGNLLSNDADAATVTTTGDIQGTYGLFHLNKDGSYTYTLDNQLSTIQQLNSTSTPLVDSITYTASDSHGNLTTAHLAISIQGTDDNHPPAVTGQTLSTNEDNSKTFTTSEFGYSDQDGDALQFVTINSIPSHGLLLLNGKAVIANQQISKAELDAGHLTFTPINNENAANYAQFTFTANDGHQNSASATMILNVNAVNDAPIVGSSFISSLEDKPHAFTAADFKYSDIDGDALNHITITNVAHGVLTLNGATVNVGDDVSASDISSLIFTPTHNYFSSNTNGLGAVQFTANDGHIDSKEGSIFINIADVADPATFGGDSTGAAQEDTTLQASGTLTASDPDGTAGFIAVQGGVGIVGSKGYGHAHIDSNGHWTYDLYNKHPIVQQLGQGQTDTETITIQSADGTQHDIVITITGTNDLPTVSEKPQAGHIIGQHSVDEDSNLNPAGQLIINDVDGDTTSVALDPTHSAAYGHVVFDAHSGTWVYHLDNSNPTVNALNDNDTLHDKFTLLVDDGHGQKVPQEITMTINGHTDPVPYAPPTISVTVDTRNAHHVTAGITPSTLQAYAHSIRAHATTVSGSHEIKGHGHSDIIIVSGRLHEEAELEGGNDILFLGGRLTDKEIEGGHGSDTLILGAYNRNNAPRLHDHGEKISDGREEMELESIENIILGDGTVLKGHLPANFPLVTHDHYEVPVNIQAHLSSGDESVSSIRLTHLQQGLTLQSNGHNINANHDGSYTVPANGHLVVVSDHPMNNGHHYFETEVTTHNSVTGVTAVTTEDLQGHLQSHLNPPPPPPPPVQHDEPDSPLTFEASVTIVDDSNTQNEQQHVGVTDSQHHDVSHHGAAAYLDALGITPDATSTTVHEQPADMDIVLAQVDHPDATTHDQAHLDMSDALEHHDANVNHNQDDEHHHHNDVDGLPDIDPNS